MSDLKPGARLPLLFFGMLSLLGGVLAGLARLGWEMPAPAAQAAGVHGPLLIAAFFGTVISLERAVAVGQGWAYLAPLAAGIHTGNEPVWVAQLCSITVGREGARMLAPHSLSIAQHEADALFEAAMQVAV